MTDNRADKAARRQAQYLAYEAMESYDPEEALHLCMKAIEIDPHCVDALTLAAGAFEPKERITRMTGVVRMAEDDLGGESYLKENKGHFWGLLETRPYMRARAYYAGTLLEAGDTRAAIAEYEALLDLNPGDNQGLRYVLIGLYLETSDLDGVHRLLDEYDDPSAAFLWSEVLAHLISGDTGEAERALLDAREANPYFEGYLLGRKPMPSEMPDHYGFGDENEAIMCVDVIGRAWKKHPEAMRWLRQHEAPTEITCAKVGRNDPCPCGSGKKYKKCCLGSEETTPSQPVRSSVAAEMALREMAQAMEGKEFSSQAEMNSFLQEYNQQRNQKPIDDFEGLSSGQMHRLINFPFESPDVVEFPAVLDADPSAPIATLFGMLADAIGEDGLKPTVKGNLPLKVVQSIALAYWGEERYQENTRYGSIRSEEDFRDLHVTRIVAELAGLVRKYKGKFILGRECRKLLKGDGMRAIYPMLLRAFADKFNWGYTDCYPETELVQRLFPFSLYLLYRHGDQWRESTFYEDGLLRAFPAVLDEVRPNAYQTSETIVRGMYSHRTIERFAGFMGLVEIERDAADRYSPVFKLKRTPVLDDAVRFHV